MTAQRSESAFDYLASIAGFWNNLCGSTRTAARVGPVTFDQKLTTYIIGFSFTAEMGLQGAYERTVCALSVFARGEVRTLEDAFDLRFRQDYAAFLEQTPWYRYPFASELARFWRETPWTAAAPVRSIERRVALSLELAVKAAYGAAMGAAAGYDPADLTLRSVIDVGPSGSVLNPQVVVVRPIAGPTMLVETPRYAAFTEIVRQLGPSGGTVQEIAGNDRILTTVLAPTTMPVNTAGAREVFSIPLQAKPGWRRVGLDTPVPALVAQIAAVTATGPVFEHAYDY